MSETTETTAATLVPPGPMVGEALHIEGDAVGRLADLGAKAAGVEIVEIEGADFLPNGLPERIPVGIVHGETPEMRSVKSLFEEWRFDPERRKGNVKATTLESYIALTDYLTGEAPVVFANTDWRGPSFVTVVDYHWGEGHRQPDWGRFRIHYPFPLSDEWKTWVDGNGKPMTQTDFAAFLEDRIAELSSPTDAERADLERTFETRLATPSELIKLSRGLSVAVGGKVKQAVNLASGEGQIVFEETHSDEGGQPLRVPGMFILQVAPFFMGEPIRIPVRLRYRVAGGAVTWFYQLYRPDRHVTDHVRAALDKVRERTELPCFEGAPEMSATGGC